MASIETPTQPPREVKLCRCKDCKWAIAARPLLFLILLSPAPAILPILIWGTPEAKDDQTVIWLIFGLVFGLIALRLFIPQLNRILGEWSLAKYGKPIIGKVIFEGSDGIQSHGTTNLLIYAYQPEPNGRTITKMLRRYPHHVVFGEGNPILLYYFPKDWNSARPSETLLFRRVGYTDRTSVKAE
jgi:hypothetical protein